MARRKRTSIPAAKPTRLVLREAEAATMASTWHEFLVIDRIGDGRFEVSVRQYEALCEYRGRIPKTYQGVPVKGVEDGILVGGDLVCEDGRIMEFDGTKFDEVAEWCAEEGFKLTEHDIEQIKNFVLDE